MTTALKLEAPDPMKALRDELHATRMSLMAAETDKADALKRARGLTYALMKAHERFDEQLAGMQGQVNDMALRVESLTARLAEVGALADRLAQEQTVRNLRSPEDNESLADQLEAHRQ